MRQGRRRVARPARPVGRTDPRLPAGLSVLLQSARARSAAERTRHRNLGAGVRRSRGAGRAAGASLRRRTRRAARSRRDRRRRRIAAGLYTNLITSAVGITAATLEKLADGRPRPRADLDSGQRRRKRRPHRRLRRRLRPQAGARRRSRAPENSADGQRRHAPRQYRPPRRDGRAGADARRQPGRDRARAILRLGAEEPRRADADAPSRSSAPPPRSRHCGRGIAARSSSTPWCPIITRGCRSPASAAGAGARSTSRRPARCCPATPPSRFPASNSGRCASIRSPTSGRTRRPSMPSAAPTGWRSRAESAPGAISISAAAAARRSR